ncbi:unnamed protein product, partial [Brenthis ino]
MWRSQSSTEEWERRKTYLIRSLFEDVPFLSPIQEEAEPGLSSFDDDFRAESPLPDLIIEVEPKKPNPHDEPEEFYERLAREMRRLYKRDHYILDSSTSTSSSLKSFEKNEYEQRLSTRFKYGSSDSEDIEDIISLQEPEMPSRSELLPINTNSDEVQFEGNNIENQKIHESYHEESSSRSVPESTVSENNSCSQQIITQAEVYTHTDEILDEITNKLKCYKDPVDKMNDKIFSSDIIEDENVNDRTYSKDLAESCDASGSNITESSELSSNFSTEIMRRIQDRASFGSLPHYKRSNSDSENVIYEKDVSMEMQPMQLSEEIISYGPKEITYGTPSDINTLLSTSTPVSKRKSKIVERKFRRRLVSYTSPSSSTSRMNVGCVSATAQTSFSDDEPDWSTFWNNFFLGIPTVYNFCSCRNHVCS